MAEATVMVADIETQEGTSQKGRAWKLYRLVDGNGDRYTTFDGSLGQAVQGLKGKRADITFTENDKGKNLDSIIEHTEKSSGGYSDPVTQRRMTVLACMKVAADIVNHAADQASEPFPSEKRIPAVKRYASELASWADEWSRKDPNDIPFSE